MERDSRSDDAYGHEVRRLLAQTVREELAAAAGMDGVELSEERLGHFAWAVSTQLDYGFRYRWDPQWVSPGQPHSWAEGDQNYARCVACLAISPPAASADAATLWYRDHLRTDHGE